MRVIWEHWEINRIDDAEKPPQDGLAQVVVEKLMVLLLMLLILILLLRVLLDYSY